MTENVSTQSHAVTISREVLCNLRSARREAPPLVRNRSSETVEPDELEIPFPAALRDDNEEIQVLHVDDSSDICQLTKHLLEDADEDLTVVTETSVVAALEQLRAHEFDCIISDYEMPNTNGLEFLEIVREQYPDLPFILFTGKGNEEIASEAISAGVTDYMQKGSETEQYDVLANRVRNAADRHRTKQQFWDALSWYQHLVEQSLAGVFIVQGGELVYVNERLTELFGYSRADLLGASPESLADGPEDAIRLREFVTRDTDSNEPRQCSFTGERGDGTVLPVDVHGGTITYNGDSACLGLVWGGRE